MAQKNIAPSIRETAFECPHCGAYTTQTWFNVFAKACSAETRTPILVDNDWRERVSADQNITPEIKDDILRSMEKQIAGLVFLYKEGESIFSYPVFNLHLSRCFNCREFSVWVHDYLLFPESRQGPPPNADMPDGVIADYEEASKILNLSPRGSAALLRLAIQKLCIELGEKGENINANIASLVRKGLPQLVQEALDAVRVIGNEAVHPGTLDLKDDRDTASNLFRVVNIIVEQMISNQKHVKELFNKLPEEKKKAIEQRDKK